MKCGFAVGLNSHEEASPKRRQAHSTDNAALPCSCYQVNYSVSAGATPIGTEALRGAAGRQVQLRRSSCSGSAAMAAIVASLGVFSGSGDLRHTFARTPQPVHGATGIAQSIAVKASIKAALPNPSLKLSPNGGPRGPGRRYPVHSRQPGPRVPPSVPA